MTPEVRPKLEELARQARHCNVLPLYLHFPYHSDDLKHPVTKLLREIVPEICEYVLILSDDEFEQFLDEIPAVWRIPLERRPERETVQQRERIAFCYLAWRLTSVYLSFADVVGASLGNSEVLRVYPELRERFDDDGLLRIDSRFELHDGGIRYREHFLHYHQFLRRGY